LISIALAYADPKLDQALNALGSVRQFRNVAVSPDGAMVAWTEMIPAKDGSESRKSAIFVKGLRDPGAIRAVHDAAESGHSPAWSRDGRLAFLAGADAKGQLQLYVAEKPGRSKPRKVTNLAGYVADAQWSPDGNMIALLWMEGVTRTPGPTEATAPDTGVVASQMFLQRPALGHPVT